MLIIFGTAMAVSLGVEAPLSYSVFSAASAAAAYAILGTTSPPHHSEPSKLEVMVVAARAHPNTLVRTDRRR